MRFLISLFSASAQFHNVQDDAAPGHRYDLLSDETPTCPLAELDRLALKGANDDQGDVCRFMI